MMIVPNNVQAGIQQQQMGLNPYKKSSDIHHEDLPTSLRNLIKGLLKELVYDVGCFSTDVKPVKGYIANLLNNSDKQVATAKLKAINALFLVALPGMGKKIQVMNDMQKFKCLPILLTIGGLLQDINDGVFTFSLEKRKEFTKATLGSNLFPSQFNGYKRFCNKIEYNIQRLLFDTQNIRESIMASVGEMPSVRLHRNHVEQAIQNDIALNRQLHDNHRETL